MSDMKSHPGSLSPLPPPGGGEGGIPPTAQQFRLSHLTLVVARGSSIYTGKQKLGKV